jgi:hypothetical protein
MCISVSETTWEEGASFHRAMRRPAPGIREYIDLALEEWISGNSQLPGIACAHCVVITRDRKVVQTRRTRNTPYSAGRWSVSFEEQITASDFESDADDPVTAAARRGFAQELQLPAESIRIQILSAVMEMPIMNTDIVVLMETDHTSEAIGEASRSLSINPEIDKVGFIGATPDRLRGEASRTDLHPTSGIRLHILARLLETGESTRVV